MEANKATSEWEHSHALNEGDQLEVADGSTRFLINTVEDDGGVVGVEDDGTPFEFTEGEITAALADGQMVRVSDGKSHELATF